MVSLEQYYFSYQVYPEGASETIDTIIDTLNDAGFLKSLPVNPFTGEAYTSSDESGQIYYTYDESEGYSLIGYGRLNESVIFSY